MAPKRLAEVRAKPVRLVAGLMTGTSMDGLDVAVCRVERDAPWRFDLVASSSEPMPGDLRGALAKGGALTVVEAAHLGRRLGDWYALATDSLARADGLDLDLVGMHGQTVYHEHGQVTVQLGEPSLVALRLGCPVVSDFRQGDIAAGGCGAPLVPVVDSWLLGRADATVMAVNIGGIANLTLIPPSPKDGIGVIGFDCGPGNMVLDELARRFTGGSAGMDLDGALAARGTVRADWLGRLLADPFLDEPPPRSTGRERYGAPFVDGLLGWAAPASRQDWLDLFATATQLTVAAIVDGAHRFGNASAPIAEVVVSGGGARNPELMRRLQLALPASRVTTSDRRGLPGSLKEAIAFALLASARLDGIPANLPSVTGARQPVLLGKITEV